MKYQLNEYVPIHINGKESMCKVFGYEQGMNGWDYHISIMEYDNDIRISEQKLIEGVNIITNGNSLKVCPLEKPKAK